jgi:hypothetical protein
VRPVLVDSTVLLDVLIGDTRWAAWSRAVLQEEADSSILVINPLIYAAISVDFDSIDDLDDAIPPDNARREPLPFAAAFLAGRLFAPIDGAAARVGRPCPTFISARTRRCGAIACSRATRRATNFPSDGRADCAIRGGTARGRRRCRSI